ncbi:hypothetical protein ACFUJR_12525 [Streptomyces sp. NPDC057271]
MADYFFTDGPAINAIIVALADAFYEALQRLEFCAACIRGGC